MAATPETVVIFKAGAIDLPVSCKYAGRSLRYGQYRLHQPTSWTIYELQMEGNIKQRTQAETGRFYVTMLLHIFLSRRV